MGLSAEYDVEDIKVEDYVYDIPKEDYNDYYWQVNEPKTDISDLKDTVIGYVNTLVTEEKLGHAEKNIDAIAEALLAGLISSLREKGINDKLSASLIRALLKAGMRKRAGENNAWEIRKVEAMKKGIGTTTGLFLGVDVTGDAKSIATEVTIAAVISVFSRFMFLNKLDELDDVGGAVGGAVSKKVGSDVGESLYKNLDLSKGFETFKDFKKKFGAAGKDKAWHHVVEQTPNAGKFPSQALHNTGNLIKLPHGKGTIHSKISGYYSSKQPFTNGQTVRKWLSNQSFNEQYDFGIQVIKDFGGAKYLK